VALPAKTGSQSSWSKPTTNSQFTDSEGTEYKTKEGNPNSPSSKADGSKHGRGFSALVNQRLPAPYPQDPPLTPDRMDINESMQNVLAVSHQLTLNDSYSQTVCPNELKLSQNGSYKEYDLLEFFQFFLETLNFEFKFQAKT
jgi:hypothetical protein